MEEKSFLRTSLGNKSVVDAITDRIINAIISGELKPGDKVPTEIELCKSLEVGRNSVREAIKKLEAYGVVEIRRAEGTFVCNNYNKKMLDPMLYGIILKKDFWKDFIELRSVVDIGTLYLVIKTCTKEQFQDLNKALMELENAVLDNNATVEKIMEADTVFHMEIAKIAKNELLESVTEYVTRITIPSRLLTIEDILEKGAKENFIELHRQFLWIIKEKRPELIEKTVLDHYIYWREKKREDK
ncbi:MAG: FadR/GntR family transcriptional regulator [Lachnospirales bacterium]